MLYGKIHQTTNWYFSHFEQQIGFDFSYKLSTKCLLKQNLTFHASCQSLRRQFVRNVKFYLLGKIKNTSKSHLLNCLPSMLNNKIKMLVIFFFMYKKKKKKKNSIWSGISFRILGRLLIQKVPNITAADDISVIFSEKIWQRIHMKWQPYFLWNE